MVEADADCASARFDGRVRAHWPGWSSMLTVSEQARSLPLPILMATRMCPLSPSRRRHRRRHRHRHRRRRLQRHQKEKLRFQTGIDEWHESSADTVDHRRCGKSQVVTIKSKS